MESLEPEDADAVEKAEAQRMPPAHYSTGRLTRVQADAVNRWRARLMLDRPLSGQKKVLAGLRMLGIDDRPRASCSDVIARRRARTARAAAK
jgi:hypothetical protein